VSAADGSVLDLNGPVLRPALSNQTAERPIECGHSIGRLLHYPI